MEKRSSTVTLDLDEYVALILHFEKINAVERLLNSGAYVTIDDVGAILDIKMPKKTEVITNG